MDLPDSDAKDSSRCFLFFLFSAPDSCDLFEAIPKSWHSLLSSLLSSSPGHFRQGNHRELGMLHVYLWGGGTIVTFFWAIKYISCSACFVICMAKRCFIFLYWNNIGIIIIIITMMIFFLSCLFLGPPSGLEALRAARSARYGSGGTACKTVFSRTGLQGQYQ